MPCKAAALLVQPQNDGHLHREHEQKAKHKQNEIPVGSSCRHYCGLLDDVVNLFVQVFPFLVGPLLLSVPSLPSGTLVLETLRPKLLSRLIVQFAAILKLGPFQLPRSLLVQIQMSHCRYCSNLIDCIASSIVFASSSVR